MLPGKYEFSLPICTREYSTETISRIYKSKKNATDSLHDRDSSYRLRRASIDKVTKRHRARNIASNSMNIAETQANQEEYQRLVYVILRRVTSTRLIYKKIYFLQK